MKKNSIFGLMAMIAASAVFTACTSDELDELSQSAEQQNVITLSSSMSQGFTRSTTTNLQATQIAAGTKVGVFVMNGSNAIDNGANNEHTADGSGGLTTLATMNWPSGVESLTIAAYAPKQGYMSYNSANRFKVQADQSTDDGYIASDLIFGTPAQNPVAKTSETIALGFSHQLAKVTFTVTPAEGVDLSGASLSINDVKTSAMISLKDNGAISEDTDAEKATSGDVKAAVFTGSATTYSCSAIIVPQTVAAGSKFVTIDSDRRVVAKLPSAITFEGGKTYNFSVKVTASSTPDVEGAITLQVTSITDWTDSGTTDLGEAEEVEVTFSPTSFGTPQSKATYEDGVYTWTAGNTNLMTILSFSAGELANYKTLEVSTSNLSDGAKWRLGYYVGSTFTKIGEYSTTDKVSIELSSLGVDLTTVTSIAFGGQSSEGSIGIVPAGVVLKGKGTSSSTGGDNTGGDNTGDGSTLTATFGTPGSKATYNAPTYAWTASNTNLMDVFTFSNGELANYKTLTFTISNLTGTVRMGYYIDGNFSKFKNADGTTNGFGSNGTKTIDLTTQDIDLSQVTKIAFGGQSNEGSVDIVATEVILSK